MAKLSDVALVLSGTSPKGNGRGEARFVRISDLSPAHRALAVGCRPTARRAVPIEPDDVLVAARGEGRLAVRPDAGLIGAFAGLDLYLLRPDPERLDPDYLASYLNSKAVADRLRTSASGGALPRIPKGALADFPLPLPPLARQVTIGRLSLCMDRYAMLVQEKLAAETRWFEACLNEALMDSGG